MGLSVSGFVATRTRPPGGTVIMSPPSPRATSSSTSQRQFPAQREAPFPSAE